MIHFKATCELCVFFFFYFKAQRVLCHMDSGHLGEFLEALCVLRREHGPPTTPTPASFLLQNIDAGST